MNKKILLLIFSVLGISLILVAYYLQQNSNPIETNAQQPIQKDLCSDLNEEECANNGNCQGIYGPSSCSGDICTTDVVFQDCQITPN